MEIKLLNEEVFSTLLKNRSVRLQHQFTEEADTNTKKQRLSSSNTLVLTASTDDLRSFFSKYGEREDLFMEMEVYNRND